MPPRLLFLTHRVPYPPDRGDRIRSWHLLRQFAQTHEVSLGCVSEEPITDAQRHALEGLTARRAMRRIGRISSRAAGLLSLARGGAITPGAFYRDDLADEIAAWHRARPFDVVVVFCSGMVRYADRLREEPTPPRRFVLDLVDVDSLKWHTLAQTARGPKRWIYRAEAARLRQIERGEGYHTLTVVSQAEARAYREWVGKPAAELRVVRNGVDLDFFHPLDEPAQAEAVLTFIGVLDYEPNADGVAWFAHEVLPRIRSIVPHATFRIVGRRPGAQVKALAPLEGVELVGPVDDVRAELARATVVVAPLRVARGTQNKVLEAMAVRRAVVATDAVAQGIQAQPDRDLLIARDAPSFADACIALLRDPARRQSLAAAGRACVETTYRWDGAGTAMVT